MSELPERIGDEDELEELLARPSGQLVEMLKRLEGDLIILGVGGKIGVSLARTARRACVAAGVKKRVIGVDLFPEPTAKEQLEQAGVETITCDFLDPAAIATLPRVKNMIFMAGRKFGTAGNQELTWAINVLVPANVAHSFTDSRIVAFSTGCVYPLVAAATGGCTEAEPPDPVGEYSQSCLGRERVFEFYSRKNGTPVCLFRLNYAVDLRYGVLHDIAQKVYQGEPVDVSVGCFNVIWQGDAGNRALLALEHAASPPSMLNVTGSELLETRAVAREMAGIMGKEVSFTGVEGDHNYLSNAAKSDELYGPPSVSAAQLIRWQAHWLLTGGRTLAKPTHFEVSDGKY